MVTTTFGAKIIAYGIDMRAAAKECERHLEENEGVAMIDRCESIDPFTPGPAPLDKLVAHFGFVFGCLHCGTRIDTELFDYGREKKIDPIFNDDAQIAFCRPQCVLEYEKEERMKFH